ncbi:MAG TPA: hypothetical protein VKE88_00695 [Candidatus Nanoarchaeia archaeon]|nr:hypothetical protein [Candidatus Nanoarchaeia archaeon]
MAKEKDFKTILIDVIKNNVFSHLKDQFDRLVDNVQDAIIITQKKLVRAITATLFLLMGALFIIIGGTFYLTDILQYSRSTVYLITGAILLLVSIILAQSSKLLKYDFKR